MTKKELIQQTKLTYDYLQKLYLEVSYLIKEVEGLLAQEDENFVIGKGGGYAITAKSSNGLDTNNVYHWLLRIPSVIFVAGKDMIAEGDKQSTKFFQGLKVIYLRIVLDEKDIIEPYLNIGIVYDIAGKKNYPSKAEQLITHIAYRQNKVFTGGNSIDYKDDYLEFKGKFIHIDLFDVNSSEDVIKLVTNPVLELYRGIGVET